jgi:hypothetical protein
MSLVLNELDNEEYEIPLEDIVESVQNERPHKSRMIPALLQDCEVIADNEATEDGDLIHFALPAYVEPINKS